MARQAAVAKIYAAKAGVVDLIGKPMSDKESVVKLQPIYNQSSASLFQNFVKRPWQA